MTPEQLSAWMHDTDDHGVGTGIYGRKRLNERRVVIDGETYDIWQIQWCLMRVDRTHWTGVVSHVFRIKRGVHYPIKSRWFGLKEDKREAAAPDPHHQRTHHRR